MIYLASDHAGFELKKVIFEHLQNQGLDIEDVGPHEYDKDDDYPDFIFPTCEKVALSKGNLGIILGGSGQGEAIAANKVKGIRAALFYGGSKDILTLSKTHNNANVLSLGARFLSKSEVVEAITVWLETKFPVEERHVRRLTKISIYEENR
jgi:ribose 5-phosphate isomerase B